MGYNNVPVNGWPQIKKLEELDALAKKMDNMPTFTSTDRAWLDEWESDLPGLAQDVSDLETDKANQVQIATVEESTTASQAYSAGDYLVLDGVLYKVTDDIAQDGTIVTEGEGKNVDLATVGGELSGLNSKFTDLLKSEYSGRALRYFGVAFTNNKFLLFLPSGLPDPQSITSVDNVVAVGVGGLNVADTEVSTGNGVVVEVTQTNLTVGSPIRCTATIVWA